MKPWNFAVVGLLIVGVSVAEAGWSGWQISYIDPSKGVDYEILMVFREGEKGEVKDCRASSLHVMPGAKIAIYSRTRFRGEMKLIREDWEAGPGTWPAIRSFRVIAAPPIRKDSRPDPPTLFVGAPGTMRKELAIDRDRPRIPEWENPGGRVLGVHVPRGWLIRAYSETGFRGDSLLIRSNLALIPGNRWYGRIRSMRIVQRPTAGAR